ncbi:fatty acid desaturase [Maritimibacter sp. DP07]|uniref:Fatty acid desaturase n=2 Tax=Maritimibacter harenae TaxID=2606218 RepID=A0A845M1D8_9RHOB|nr:fatty acid desaturase [Maritimibacter harenae]
MGQAPQQADRTAAVTPSDWARALMRYREPIAARSWFELGITLIPFTAIWGLAWGLISFSPVLAFALAVGNTAFLVRLFMIQHDCGHGAFFKSRTLSDWIGRGIGVLTLTPYDVWRRNHAIHHSTTGNLDKRGVGDIPTLTVREYEAKGRLGRGLYRLLRHPAFLFVVVPFYTFFLQNRVPVGQMRSGWQYWFSAMATNAAIGTGLCMVAWFGGPEVVFVVILPTLFLAAMTGMWLFYVQHQFEDTVWDRNCDWNIQSAAFHGSSHYVLPGILRWITANIGVHHVHHLASRIPFYRLNEVLRDHAPLADAQRITLKDSLQCARLRLWDENSRRLVFYKDARGRLSN